MENYEMPVGLGMALAQRPEIMKKFADLSETEKHKIINGTHSVSSKKKCKSMWMKLCLNTNL